MKKLVFAVLLAAAAVPAPGQNLSDITPAAPTGNVNCRWQKDSSNPANISCYIPVPSSNGNQGYGVCRDITIGTSPMGNALTPGLVTFGASNYWHTDISAEPVDPNSDSIVQYVNADSSNSKVSKVTIASIAIASGVLTVTGGSTLPLMSVGRTVQLTGLTTATFLNNQSVVVTALAYDSSWTVTGFTANYTHANYAQASDTGLATTTDSIVYLHSDFGKATGIPFTITDSSQTPLVPFSIDAVYGYPDESDLLAWPASLWSPIEGLGPDCVYPPGDAHLIVLDKSTCFLYESYSTERCSNQFTSHGSTALWDLDNYNTRPVAWTSVDAAGLPVMPGLLRYDEVALGAINHAIRITFRHTHHGYVTPATHWAGNDDGAATPSPIPMGMRIRLKASYSIAGFSTQNQVILRALKQYGGIVADNGGNLMMTGTVDGRWDDDDLHNLTLLTMNDFEVVQMPSWYVRLSRGYQITFRGLTAATWLNGQSVTVLAPGAWSGFMANFTHADYPVTSDSGTATLAALPAGMGTLAGAPMVMPIQSVAVSGNTLSVVLANGSGSNIPRGSVPVVNSFTASPASIAAGGASTLRWNASGASYVFLTQAPATNPQVGATRGASAAVSPAVTTTYTLHAVNGYGAATVDATVTVH